MWRRYVAVTRARETLEVPAKFCRLVDGLRAIDAWFTGGQVQTKGSRCLTTTRVTEHTSRRTLRVVARRASAGCRR